MLVNVGVGWVSYLLAEVFAERALWLPLSRFASSLQGDRAIIAVFGE